MTETAVKCTKCGKEMPSERVDLLNITTCIKCTPQPAKLYGVMEYSHKNTGSLVITDDRKVFLMLKKPANQRR